MFGKLLNRFGYVHKSQVGKRNFGFPAASNSRLLDDWPISNVSADSLLRRDLVKLRPRSRHLALRDPYFVKYLSLVESNVIGSKGMTLKNKAADPPRMVGGKIEIKYDLMANRLIEDAFSEWGKKENCTMSRDLSWVGVQRLIIRTVATDGEVFIRLIRGKAAKNKFNFALKLYEGDFVDIECNRMLPNGNEVRMGIERNQWGERQNIWIFKNNPNDTFYPSSFDNRYQIIPASEFIHVYLPRRVDQTRGFPWAWASMLRMNMLDGLEEGALIRLRAEANKHGFFKVTGDVAYEGPKDGNGLKLMDSEPGTWEELPQGLEPVPINWGATSGDLAIQIKQAIQGIATGLTVSYPTLGNDYASVNFSSGRMSQLEEREVWTGLQFWKGESVCDPIFSNFLEMSMMSGEINLPVAKFDKFNQPHWAGKRFAWVDPQAEVSAKILEINSGLTTLSDELTAMSKDPDEQIAKIKHDQEAIDAVDLTLPEIYQEQPDPNLAPKPGSARDVVNRSLAARVTA